MTSEAADTDKACVYVGTTTGEVFYTRNSGELLPFHLPAVLSLEACGV